MSAGEAQPAAHPERNWLHVSGTDENFVPHTRAPMVKEIISVVCEVFSVSESEIRSECKKHAYCHPRFAASYLARSLTNKSFPLIGTFLGGRDHTTILNATRRAKSLLASSASFAEKVAMCRAIIRQRYMDV